MTTFASLGAAMESSYFRAEDANAVRKHAERLVKEGKLPASSVTSLTDAHTPAIYGNIPTVVRHKPAAENVYNHVKGTLTERRPFLVDNWLIGTERVSLGRARWTVDNTSIFSVADGKRLAQTPVRVPTAFEAARLRKIDKAAVESPLLQGYRLLPQFTPGRALLWGTILAVWGTAGLVVTSARHLGITRLDEAKAKLEASVAPYAQTLASYFEPLQGQLQLQSFREAQRPTELAELADKIRRQMKS